MHVSNFGKNVSFDPKKYYVPESEAEVLELLGRNPGTTIRVIGRLHSWSEVILGNHVVLDLRKLNEVRVELRSGESWAIVGGGAQIKHIVTELETKHGLTLPSLGLITEQTIAGAAATGTHGSGKHSLSHYIDEVRIAHFDPVTGEPLIRCISAGNELRAARCALGCMGVVLSVAIRCRPQYLLEQHFQLTVNLEDVLDAEGEYPQQQFYLLPFRWDYLVQHRRESSKNVNWLSWLYRLYWFLTVDVALHIVVIALRRWLRSNSGIRAFFKYLVPIAVIRGWRVIDRSQNLLTMQHELFRHIEVEIFVLRQHLPAALNYTKQLLQYLDGDRQAIERATWKQLVIHGLDGNVEECGSYTHHYPICIRKVLSDDTLISMASGAEDAYYALSFISYDRPTERASFFTFADLLVKTTAQLFDARPHWGKYCPIDAATASRLYPMLSEFGSVCDQRDPSHVFRNAWTASVLWPE